MTEQEYFEFLESGIAKLPEQEQAKIFKTCAEKCVEGTVLKVMRQQFEECGCSLDAQYTKYGHTEFFWAKIIEPNHIYELGYPRCFCPMVEKGFAKSIVHCECSRQSILQVLNNLLPNNKIEVKTISTVLSGADKCTFRVTVSEIFDYLCTQNEDEV